MKKEMYDLSEFSIKTAKAAGADECRVNINSERFVEISYRSQKPENIKEASKMQLSVEIFVNKRYSRQWTSDLRMNALKTFITNAVSATKLLAEDPFRILPDPKYYQGRANVDLGINDPDYKNLTAEGRHKMAKAIEKCLPEKRRGKNNFGNGHAI